MATAPVQALLIPEILVSDLKNPITIQIPAEEFNDTSTWAISPVSKQLGLPIKASRYPVPANDEQENEVANTLFLDTDVTSACFALPTRESYLGSVVIVRCDGHDLDATALATLVGKTKGDIEGARDRFQDVMAGKQTIPEFYAQARANFTRESAAMLYRDLMDGEAGYVNPFRTTAVGGIKFCEGCGAVKADSGGAVRVCGKCRSACYCSRDCQKQEWATHKVVCREPS